MGTRQALGGSMNYGDMALLLFFWILCAPVIGVLLSVLVLPLLRVVIARIFKRKNRKDDDGKY
jgi:hypothetical protein